MTYEKGGDIIPYTSYGRLYLYLEEPSFYRDTLLALTGEDIYDQAPFHALIDFLSATLNVEEHQTITPIYGSIPFIGGNAALNQLAVKYNDGRAAGLQQLLLKTPVNSFFHDTQERGFYYGILWGAFTHPKNIDPIEPLPRQTSLHWYEDSGQVHYYDANSDVAVNSDIVLMLNQRESLTESHRHFSNAMPIHTLYLIDYHGSTEEKKIIDATIANLEA